MTSPVGSTAGSDVLLSALTTRQKVERILSQLPAQTTGEPVAQPSQQELLAPVQRINQVMRRYGIEFEMSEQAHRTIIRVVDRESGELIRQIPPDEAMTISRQLEEIRGRLLRWKT